MNKGLKKSLLVSVAALSLGVGFTSISQMTTSTVMAAKKYKVIKTKKLKKYRVSYKSNGVVYSKSNLSKKRTTLKKIKKNKLYVTKQETVRKYTKKGKAYNSRYLYVKNYSHSKNSGWVHNSHFKKYKKSSKGSYTWGWSNSNSSDDNEKTYSYSQAKEIAKNKFISFVNSERTKVGAPTWIHDSGAQQVADIRAQQLAKLNHQDHYTNPDTGKVAVYPNSSARMPMFNEVETDLGFLNDPWNNSMLDHSDESLGQIGDMTNSIGNITKNSIDGDIGNGIEGMITFDGASDNGHKKMLLSPKFKYYAIGMDTVKDQYNNNCTWFVVIVSAEPLTKANASAISSNSSSTSSSSKFTIIDPDAIPRSQDDKNYVGSSAQKADQAKAAQSTTTVTQ